MSSKKKFLGMMVELLAICMLLSGCIYLDSPDYSEVDITEENRLALLNELNIEFYKCELVKGEVQEREASNEEIGQQFFYEFPDINNYPLDIKGSGEIDVEIFLPLENNGSGMRELVEKTAKEFNSAKLKDTNGHVMSVSIRALDSSLAEDFINSRSYMPKGYIAPNELCSVLMQANGIEVQMVSSKLVGNTMGIAIAKEKYDEFAKTGSVAISDIVKANMDGKVSIGYTNPTNNPTGLNFVVSMLAYFDASNPNSFEATTNFASFQNTVPTVSYSTEQMVKAVQNGTINAFIIEHEAFLNANIENEFVFIPFGVRHDYPLLALEHTTEEEQDVLKKFAEYFQQDSVQEMASKMKFNLDASYESTVDVSNYPGSMLNEILRFWKEGKASGKQIAAIFVADISGSMKGSKLDKLKESLTNAMQYISEDSKVGIISYDENVYYNLPLGEFTHEQQEYFAGAVNSLEEQGNTATNSAMLQAIKILEEERNINGIKPIIILLSDGDTNMGYKLDENIEKLIKAFNIPIYTIAYGSNANKAELNKIADLNGGTFINASTDDVGYKIKLLFNAEM